MGFQETGGYCNECNRKVMIRRPATNHIFHLLATLFTLSMWFPIWALSCVRVGGWRCTACGTAVSRLSRGSSRSDQGEGAPRWVIGLVAFLAVVFLWLLAVWLLRSA